MYDERRVAPENAEDARGEIQEFIGRRFPDITCYMITLKKDGTPSIRQVSTFVEGWTVGTISQSTHIKNLHIRRNPNVTYLWTELKAGEFRSAKNVWLNGTCEIVEDQAEVQAFLERRAAAYGQPLGESKYLRYLLRTTPTYLRAEGFTGPRRPVILTEF